MISITLSERRKTSPERSWARVFSAPKDTFCGSFFLSTSTQGLLQLIATQCLRTMREWQPLRNWRRPIRTTPRMLSKASTKHDKRLEHNAVNNTLDAIAKFIDSRYLSDSHPPRKSLMVVPCGNSTRYIEFPSAATSFAIPQVLVSLGALSYKRLPLSVGVSAVSAQK